MNCPYCRKSLTASKVVDTTFFCWRCLIMVEIQDNNDLDIIHMGPLKPFQKKQQTTS